jgi:hypothetical protein
MGWARSVWAPAVAVAVALGALLVAYFALGGDIRDFIHIGTRFLTQGGDASPYIRFDPTYHGYATDGTGYDGQFYYYFAVDPMHSVSYMDDPAAYRLSRPFYPLLARALALGQPGAIPWTLLLINWLAIAGTALALGDILRRRGFSPWLALLYVVYPGTLSALHADVTEPLAYGLVALGWWLHERGGKRVWLWSGMVFALAALTRETAAAFPAALAIGAVIGASRGRLARDRGILPRLTSNAIGPAIWLAGVMAPYLAWKAAVLGWMGSAGIPSELVPSPIPFLGLAQLWPWPSFVWGTALFVGVPGALCMGLALWGLWRRPDAPELWALALHTLLFCILLRSVSWDLIAAYRLSIGALVALLLALPLLARLASRSTLWATLIIAMWLALAPVAFAGFFPALARLLGAS